ncbi:MAG TPA: hypothetical protein VF791_01630 [Pyrinomonadaceae bacterium]
MKKICSSCKCEKPLSEFGIKGKKKDGSTKPQSMCKQCHREYTQRHYKENKEYYKKKAKVNDQKKVARFHEFLIGKSCVDCGESDPIVLEFDHCTGKKQFTIANMLARKMGWDSLMKEIAKCVVRCANCHRRKTAKEHKWRKANLAVE